jgi:feruloyl esterase
VETGAAPARIEALARQESKYFPGRMRPLCPYPAYARYSGMGSLDDGANFACVAPR